MRIEVDPEKTYYRDRILNWRPKYLLDENRIGGAYQYKYKKSDGRITIYAHFADGMEVWEYNPTMWEGWKLMLRYIGEKEEY